MRKLVFLSIGFAFGCAVCAYLVSGSWLFLVAFLCLVAGCVGCFLKSELLKKIAVGVIGFSIGLTWFQGYQVLYIKPVEPYDGQTISADIEASEYSRNTDYGCSVAGYLKLEDKQYKVNLYLNDSLTVKPGDSISGNFKLRLTTLGGEQETTYHQGKGVFLLLYEKEGVIVEPCSEIPTKFFAVKLRDDITATIKRIFPEDTQGFVRALLLGDSEDLSYEEDSSFQISGIRHIIAVSGLHVSILFALIYMLAGKNRVLTAVLGIPILILFAAVAGFTPSINRACVMQVLMILAMLVKKEYDPPTALSCSVVLMLTANPMTIVSVSFQLSVGCMVGLFLYYRPVCDYLLKRLHCQKGNSLRSKLTRWVCGSVSVTLSAMIFTTPLSAWYFHTVSIIGVLTNLLVLWLISVLFYGIMAACVIGALSTQVGAVIAAGVSVLIRLVKTVALWLAGIPFAAVYTCSVYIVLWLVMCYLLLAIFLVCRRKRPALLVGLIVAGLFLSLGASYLEPRMDSYRVSILDVGQGQSILLQNGGRNYLVDCGGDSPEGAADTVAQYLLSQGITRLDGLILTHYDKDHAGGVLNLMSRVPADCIYLPDIPDDMGRKVAITDSGSERIEWVRKERELKLPQGSITMLPGDGSANENDGSLCILFQVKKYDILITGDRNNTGERALLATGKIPELDVLVVGHHGAASATGFELLSVTKPKTAVISVGKDNSFGHPSEQVLKRLSRFGCEVWRTDLHGTIIFRG